MESTSVHDLLKNRPLLLTNAQDVDDVCQPLKDLLEINWFGYVRQYSDNTRIHLDNNLPWAAHFYKSYHRYLTACALIEKQEYSSGFYLQDYFPPHMQLIVKEARDNFSIGNSLVIIEKFTDYQEICFFGAKLENKQIVNIYLSHLNLIKQFITYFKERAACLIKTAEKNRIALPAQQKLKLIDNSFLLQKEKLNILQSFLSAQIGSKDDKKISLLTEREHECLLQMTLGKTSKEIARTLDVSYKTIENHLANIRQKLGYRRKIELVKFFLQSGAHFI
jgi:DNA-binding CsgD family transcriptional regulator